MPMAMTVHTMWTTMPPPRSRKARQGVRAAELRVSPDAGKCGNGHARQKTISAVTDPGGGHVGTENIPALGAPLVSCARQW